MEPVDVAVVQFPSADGTRLEGDLLTPADAGGSAVVCHPHPLYGGSRQDAVVAALSRALVGAGRRVLRFDFRGTGGSDGEHDNGRAEREDLRAAIDMLDPVDGPLMIAGYSFGADIALSVDHPAADQWLTVAPPLTVVAPGDMVARADERPVTVIIGAHDQFNPPDRLEPELSSWTNVSLQVVDTADHFFAGALRQVSDLAAAAAEG